MTNHPMLAAAVGIWVIGLVAGWCAGWAARGSENRAWHRGLVVGVQERQGLGILRGKGHPALLQKSTRHLGANLHEDMLSLHGYLVVTHQ